jgi:Flp pilus assembly protein TadD
METYCRAVLAEDPHAWTLQNNLGVVLKQKGEFADAIACYRQSLEDNPGFAEARNNLGNALAATGDFAGAEAQFLEALKLRPGNPELLSSLAEAYWSDGKTREAFAAQAGAITADRTNPKLYTRFGLMLAANKQFPQAVTCFKNALVLDPDNVETQINLIRGLLTLGRREEAIAACQQALQTARKSGDEKLIRIVGTLLDQAMQPPVRE